MTGKKVNMVKHFYNIFRIISRYVILFTTEMSYLALQTLGCTEHLGISVVSSYNDSFFD